MELVVEVVLVVLVVMEPNPNTGGTGGLGRQLPATFRNPDSPIGLLDPLDLFLELIQVVIPQVISGSLVVAVVVLMVELTEVVVVELLLVIVLLVVVMVVTIQTVWELMEPNLPVVEVVPLIMGSWILATVGVTVVLVSFSSHILLDK